MDHQQGISYQQCISYNTKQLKTGISPKIWQQIKWLKQEQLTCTLVLTGDQYPLPHLRE